MYIIYLFFSVLFERLVKYRFLLFCRLVKLRFRNAEAIRKFFCEIRLAVTLNE